MLKAAARRKPGPQEGIDHLFLLPERALAMDSGRLQQDLAGLDFSVRVLHSAPQGNVWLSGAAPVDGEQGRHSSRNAPAVKGQSGTLHWFAYVGQEPDLLQNESVSEAGKDAVTRDREERLRLLKERQNEERQRKLEELKQQALAAQKFREQKEEERRRRIEELRQRDNDRRLQVEERKRQIYEAERDRREAILRKNQEREARIDSKRKNERSSAVFAFGSSTPRMLEPADTGGSFWGTRRATSTSNVMMFTATPLTRRSSERELDGTGKKRATSASGLDRKPGEGEEADGQQQNAAQTIVRVNRRKTDLMPTIPSPRDTTPSSSSRRAPSRSPGRALSMSRLDVLSQPRFPRRQVAVPTPAPRQRLALGSSQSMSRSTGHLAAVGADSQLRRMDAARSMSHLCGNAPPVPPPRTTRAERLRQQAAGLRSGEVTPSRPVSALSQHSVNSVGSGTSLRTRPSTAPRRPRPFSIAVTGVSHEPAQKHGASGEQKSSKLQSPGGEKEVSKPPIPRVHGTKKPTKPENLPKKPTEKITKVSKASPKITPKGTPLQSPGSEGTPLLPQGQEVSEAEKDKIISKENSKAEGTESTGSDVVAVVPTTEPGEFPEKTNEIVKEPVESKETEKDISELSDLKEGPSSKELIEPSDQQEEIKKSVESSEIKKEVTDLNEGNKKPLELKEEKSAPQITGDIKSDALEAGQVVTGEEMQEVKGIDTSTAQVSETEAEMTASMIAKTRITTEEEAKAALAERRRLAREQAEREAELERQRLEEERRKEEERIRLEEEEQRRFEEEQLRLVEEARKAEEQRLLLAIQENERREREEKKKREEEMKAKAEKEEAERKAREEAERLRKEMDERLKKEEEERIARRKRVEAIMSRTRGKGATPTSTPVKGQLEGESGGDEDGKDVSPTEERKIVPSGDGHMDVGNKESMETEKGTDVVPSSVVENGKTATSEQLLTENSNVKTAEISGNHVNSNNTNLEPVTQLQNSNGHRNGTEYRELDFGSVDNVKQSNTLEISTSNTTQQAIDSTEFEQILDLNRIQATGKLANEDNVNSNIMTNGPNAPIIAFQDNLSKKQDTNSVTDLLS
ncbi:MAP7 domain-containing protein 1-like isoform X21 [Schistocerca serialis cubense]|uniref:MAP7 domain-containing protein 1-like isoform X21 n=1 Tax=Schistocerca serialis cubense TaxID=2023355 RepID=UPI00214EB6B3|nr:MAP7 domain-containing protein 1-like isoform X21 [Schistocerca serialis cubense]